MRTLLVAVAAVTLSACSCSKKDEPKPTPEVTTGPRPDDTAAALPGPHPRVVQQPGALHAVQCGEVTAVWTGKDEGPGPKELHAEKLHFLLGDGRSLPYQPTGETFPADTSFDVFSPDCEWVVLPTDHYGPYALVKLNGLGTFLAKQGSAAPLGLLRVDGQDARVHSDAHWLSPTEVEFVASCCGGAEVYVAPLAAPSAPKKVFEAKSAPHGVRKVNGAWELVP